MIISAIVAMGKNRQIGLNNQLLWKLPADLKIFKETTLGHTLIMGRKTYESIGRPLPGRKTFIISRSFELEQPEDLVNIYSSIDEALLAAAEAEEKEIFICGGGQIYTLAAELIEKLYISVVDYDGDADTYFPEMNLASWNKVSNKFYAKDSKNKLDFEFSIYTR